MQESLNILIFMAFKLENILCSLQMHSSVSCNLGGVAISERFNQVLELFLENQKAGLDEA